MTKRERYLSILGGKKADGLVFAPNFDFWLGVARKNNALAPRYNGLSRDDIVRDLGGTIWSRTGVFNITTPDVSVETVNNPDGSCFTYYNTPVGTVSEKYIPSSDISGTMYMVEHKIKNERDIETVKFIVENTQFEINDDKYIKALESVGDDGVCLSGLPWCMPYIQFGKTDCGWERGIYFYYDYFDKVEALMDAYTQKIEQAARLAAKSNIKILALGDNMDELTTPPDIFKRHAISFYKRISSVLHEQGKLFEVHWCGRTKNLLPLTRETGIDIIEAVTVEPMDTLTIPRALDMVGDRIVIQGGIPSVLMVQNSFSYDETRAYVKNLIVGVPHGYRYAVGMSDNLPANGDIERIRLIAEMVNETVR